MMLLSPEIYTPQNKWDDVVTQYVVRLEPLVASVIWKYKLMCLPGLYLANGGSHLPITTDTDLFHEELYKPVTHSTIVGMKSGTIIDRNDYKICTCKPGAYTLSSAPTPIAYRAATLIVQRHAAASWHVDVTCTDNLGDYYPYDPDYIEETLSELIFLVDSYLVNHFDNIIRITNIGPVLVITILGDYRLYGR